MSNNINHLIRPESEPENPQIDNRGGGCQHLSELRSRIGSNPFINFPGCVKVRPLGRASIKRDTSHVLVRCGVCGHAPHRLYACVTCAAVFCHAHVGLGPRSQHLADADGSSCVQQHHNITVEIDRAELFCCVCRDQVYDRDFDAAVVLAQTEAAAVAIEQPPLLSENIRKRRRVEYKPWTPDVKEQVLIVGNSNPFPSQMSNDTLTTPPEVQWGLRGLNNLGNTCFMNSVLQALLHTPPLRNYFLSDKHNRYFCQRKNSTIVTRSSSSSGDNNANKNSMLCLACDLDAMFSAVFSGDRSPISPAKFLYSWWKHASNLASYEQQDAHEFFISVLDGIHERMQNDKGKAPNPGCDLGLFFAIGSIPVDICCQA